MIESRRAVARGWLAVANDLHDEGRKELSQEVLRIVKAMPPPRTEREQLYEQLLDSVRTSKLRDQKPLTR